jgi:hypothetical protein
MGQAFGVVQIFIPGEATEYGLAKQAGQNVPGVPASATFGQRCTSQIGQPERVVQLTICE